MFKSPILKRNLIAILASAACCSLASCTDDNTTSTVSTIECGTENTFAGVITDSLFTATQDSVDAHRNAKCIKTQENCVQLYNTDGSVKVVSYACSAAEQDHLYCNYTDVDASSDVNNCGTCGNKCNTGDQCVNGVCKSNNNNNNTNGCTTNELKCENNNLMVCNANKTWEVKETCAKGCENKACVTDNPVNNQCTSNSCKDASTLLVCDTTTGTTTEENCPNGCNNGACVNNQPDVPTQQCEVDSCKDNTTRLVCDKTTGKTSEEKCPGGCADGVCTTLKNGDNCNPETFQGFCNGNLAVTCVKEYTHMVETKNCPEGKECSKELCDDSQNNPNSKDCNYKCDEKDEYYEQCLKEQEECENRTYACYKEPAHVQIYECNEEANLICLAGPIESAYSKYGYIGTISKNEAACVDSCEQGFKCEQDQHINYISDTYPYSSVGVFEAKTYQCGTTPDNKSYIANVSSIGYCSLCDETNEKCVNNYEGRELNVGDYCVPRLFKNRCDKNGDELYCEEDWHAEDHSPKVQQVSVDGYVCVEFENGVRFKDPEDKCTQDIIECKDYELISKSCDQFDVNGQGYYSIKSSEYCKFGCHSTELRCLNEGECNPGQVYVNANEIVKKRCYETCKEETEDYKRICYNKKDAVEYSCRLVHNELTNQDVFIQLESYWEYCEFGCQDGYCKDDDKNPPNNP